MRLIGYPVFIMSLFAANLAVAACDSDLPASTGHLKVLTTVANGAVVADSKTKLMWKRCLEGYTYTSPATCTGNTVYTWSNTLARPDTANSGSGFAGHTDWRLPNVKELQSIVEVQCSNPAINTTVFPNTPALPIWSNSPHASTEAWYVDFNSGYTLFEASTVSYGVRLVRDCTGTECD